MACFFNSLGETATVDGMLFSSLVETGTVDGMLLYLTGRNRDSRWYASLAHWSIQGQ